MMRALMTLMILMTLMVKKPTTWFIALFTRLSRLRPSTLLNYLATGFSLMLKKGPTRSSHSQLFLELGDLGKTYVCVRGNV